MATLYSLTSSMIELLNIAQDSDLDAETLQDTMEAMNGEYEEKLEGYAIIIKELEAEQAKFSSESKRLKEESDRIGKNIDRMKKCVFESMKAVGEKKVQTEHFKWSIAKNGGKLPLICDDDPSNVPAIFHKTTVTVDKDKIRAALDNGEKLDFACYGERGESVRLK